MGPHSHHRAHVQRAQRTLLSLAALTILLTAVTTHAVAPPTPTFRVLIFSKTAGFRHTSIEPGLAAVRQLGVDNGFTVDATEDGSAFEASLLDEYAAVVFLSTTGDVLTPEQQNAFETYIRNGGGFVGIHSATDTEYDWAWYGGLVGAYFLGHPAPQVATLLVEDHVHESTAHLGGTWQRVDEWYDFRDNPRERVHVLLSLDPTTLVESQMGSDHPIAWCHDYDGGRAWYTGLGHTDESWSEPAFLQHVLGGIRTAAGASPAGCSSPVGIDTSTTAASTTATTTAPSPDSSAPASVASPSSSPPSSGATASSDGSSALWLGASVAALAVAAIVGTILVRRRRLNP